MVTISYWPFSPVRLATGRTGTPEGSLRTPSGLALRMRSTRPLAPMTLSRASASVRAWCPGLVGREADAGNPLVELGERGRVRLPLREVRLHRRLAEAFLPVEVRLAHLVVHVVAAGDDRDVAPVDAGGVGELGEEAEREPVLGRESAVSEVPGDDEKGWTELSLVGQLGEVVAQALQQR
jgi:hypothetical protein